MIQPFWRYILTSNSRCPSLLIPGPSLADPCLTLAWASQKLPKNIQHYQGTWLRGTGAWRAGHYWQCPLPSSPSCGCAQIWPRPGSTAWCRSSLASTLQPLKHKHLTMKISKSPILYLTVFFLHTFILDTLGGINDLDIRCNRNIFKGKSQGSLEILPLSNMKIIVQTNSNPYIIKRLQ